MSKDDSTSDQEKKGTYNFRTRNYYLASNVIFFHNWLEALSSVDLKKPVFKGLTYITIFTISWININKRIYFLRIQDIDLSFAIQIQIPSNLLRENCFDFLNIIILYIIIHFAGFAVKQIFAIAAPSTPSNSNASNLSIPEQFRDVVKMNDYLTTGRRQEFWEEPFTRRVMDAIKSKELEMKTAAEILGVSYGTLYGRYRDSYGCLKHPYR